MKTTGAIALSLLASAAIVAAQTPSTYTPPAPGKSRIIQRVLVKVNGEVFTQTDLERQQINELRNKQRQVQDLQALENDATLIPLLQEVTPDILVDAVDELLLVQYGRELGYKLTDADFKAAVERFKTDQKIDDAQLAAGLAGEGLTMTSWREMMEHTKIIQDVQRDEIMQKATALTEQELHQYYDAHPDEFKTDATVTLREILISVPTQTQGGRQVISAADQEAAKAKADAISARLKSGEDFVKVAGEVSDSPTKSNGGMLGTYNLEEIEPKLREILEQLKPGESTAPLPTQRGFQILRVDAITTPAPRPFDEVRNDIRQKIYGERVDAETRKFLTSIRTQALIEWKDPTLKEIYDKRLAERVAQGR
jgi:peptidyl-prolyl cis-trans isomerase SurA